MTVDVREEYNNYSVSRPLKPYVEDLLRVVPAQYLRGLDFVMITDSEGQSRAMRRRTTRSRGRKVLLRKSRGYYAPAYRGELPHIVLHVDQIEAYRRKRAKPFRREGIRWQILYRLTSPFLNRKRIAEVLYDEIGHHIHMTSIPEYREPENVAEQYRWMLTKRLTTRRWYLAAMMILAFVVLYPVTTWRGMREILQGG